jgi:hypothetical protein
MDVIFDITVKMKSRGRDLYSSTTSLRVSRPTYLEIRIVAAQQCKSTVIDGTCLPHIQLFGLHEREVN